MSKAADRVLGVHGFDIRLSWHSAKLLLRLYQNRLNITIIAIEAVCHFLANEKTYVETSEFQ